MNYAEQRAAAFETLLGRLTTGTAIARLGAGDIEAHAARHELLALLYTGEAARSPESWDVCVILPELLASCGGIAGAILDPAESSRAASRFGVDKLPALVVLRRGAYLGVIEGVRDWLPFVQELALLREGPAQPPPVAGQYPASPSATRSA